MSDLILALVQRSASLVKTRYPVETATLSQEFIASAVQDALDQLLPQQIELASTRPDYESVLFQLMTALESGNAWKDRSLSASGQMILRAVATDVAFSQFSLARALMEAFPQTAQNETSIYENTRRAGVRLTRKRPQVVNVNLRRLEGFTQGLTIPKMSQFRVGGQPYFNREAVLFSPDTLVVPTHLFEGTIMQATSVSTGVAYQEIELGNENWNISDEDVSVLVNTEEWRRITDPLFLYRRDKVFHDSTLHNGNVALTFGNGAFGAKPGAGVNLRVTWAETKGAAASVPYENAEVLLTSDSGLGVTGEFVSLAVAGGDQLPLSYYKQFASDLHAMLPNKAPHRRVDHRALALSFPGVYDVRFQGQAERMPNRPSAAMMVWVTLLTDPVFTTEQWNEFAAYFESGVPFKPRLIREDAAVKPYDLDVVVYCMPKTNLEQIKNRLKQQLAALFAPKPGKLGYSIYKDSIYECLKGQEDLKGKISFVKENAPIIDAMAGSINEWIKLRNLNIETRYSTRDYDGRIN